MNTNLQQRISEALLVLVALLAMFALGYVMVMMMRGTPPGMSQKALICQDLQLLQMCPAEDPVINEGAEKAHKDFGCTWDTELKPDCSDL